MANISAATITLRGTKGSPLTNTEVDNNFSALNTALQTGLTAASYTAADVLAKLITVDGTGSLLDADFLDGLDTSSALPAGVNKSSVVVRDSSGNFAGNTITATNFSGTFTGVAAITSGSITTLTTALPIGSGGTGSNNAPAARTALGLAIGTDVQAYDAELAALASVSSAAGAVPYFTGVGTAGTYTSSAFMRGLEASADQATARTGLGLTIGTDVQAYANNLAGLSSVSSNGIYIRTGAATATVRSIAAGSGITVQNGDGTGGNPTINANVLTVQGNTGNVIVSVPVTSVQGNTGAVIVNVPVQSVNGATGNVIVSVPVSSVQGNTGAVIVSNVSHAFNSSYSHAAHSSDFTHHSSHAPWGGIQGRPGHLSQFTNDMAVAANTKVNSFVSVWGRGAGSGNHGQYSHFFHSYNCYGREHLDTGTGLDPHHHYLNCINCNCNC
jgi:hypothetical protein